LIPNVSRTLAYSLEHLTLFCGEKNWHFDTVRLNCFENLKSITITTLSCIAIDVLAALSDVQRKNHVEKIVLLDPKESYSSHYPFVYTSEVVYVCLPGLKHLELYRYHQMILVELCKAAPNSSSGTTTAAAMFPSIEKLILTNEDEQSSKFFINQSDWQPYTQLASLQELVLKNCKFEDPTTSPWDIFAVCTNLQSLSMNHMAFNIRDIQNILQLATDARNIKKLFITHDTIYSRNMPNSVEFTKAFTHLEELSLR
jgi:hypothetical protein